MRTVLALRSQLLLLVGVPLLLLVLIESLVSYRIGIHTGNQVFDRWLLDSANTLLLELDYREQQVHFVADSRTVSAFEWDELDEVWFQILTTDLQPVAGAESLSPVASVEALRRGPMFRDIEVEGQQARAVSLLSSDTVDPVLVTVAETLNKRRGLYGELLFEVLISKAVLLLAVLLIIGIAFDRGLRPLIKLGRELAQRSPQDLTPIELGMVPGELRGLVENTNTLLSHIETAISAREQFIGNIAHQIRTPLAGMKLQAQLALGESDPALVHAALENIVNAADHMAHVNSQLMKLARAEAACGRGLRRTPVDLVVVVRSCCAELSSHAHKQGIQLVPQVPQHPVMVTGELILLAEMVGNLVHNSITYGAPGGHVWIRMEETVEGVQLVVEDDGPGIPAEHWPRIFERFFRPARSSGNGCGLGLAIVREIALAHGASVELRTRDEGPGVKFVTLFPSSQEFRTNNRSS